MAQLNPDRSLDLVRDLGRAAILMNPLRLRILLELRQPDSASGLSRRLGMARQKVNYHLRELESSGFVELVQERKKGNCIERVLKASARCYLVDPRVLGQLGADRRTTTDRFSSTYLIAVAARVLRDVSMLRERAQGSGKELPTLTLESELRFASAEAQAAFAAELTREMERLVSRYHDEHAPKGRRFRLFLGSYPRVEEQEQEGEA